MPKITTERHYKLILSDGSTYYGRTTLPGDKRYKQHIGDVKRGKHSCLQEIYNKYGCDDWVQEWLGWETGDRNHHNKVEFGRVKADPKALNIQDGSYILNPKEYWQVRREGWTSEERERFNHRQRKYDTKKRIDNREEYNRRAREYYHKQKKLNEQ